MMWVDAVDVVVARHYLQDHFFRKAQSWRCWMESVDAAAEEAAARRRLQSHGSFPQFQS